MRSLWILLALMMFLSACSQGGGFHVAKSKSVVSTDPQITPENEMIIRPRAGEGEKAPPHVLGYLEVSDASLEKNAGGELTFTAQVSLKESGEKVRWESRTELRGKLNIEGGADLYPANGDVSGDLPVRARITCLSENNPLDCDQAIIDVYVKEGEKIHAAQVLAEMRENVPPEDFAPKKEGTPQREASPEPEPVLNEEPRAEQKPEETREEEEAEGETAPVYSPSGPKQRFAMGPAARKRRAEEKARAEADLRARMNPEAPAADPALKAALEKKAEEYRQKLRPAPRTTPKQGRLKQAPRTTPKQGRLKQEASPALPKAGALDADQEKNLQARLEGEAGTRQDEALKAALEKKAEEYRRKQAAQSGAPAAIVKTETPAEETYAELPENGPVPRQKPLPEENAEAEEEDEMAETEGTDPTDRPSLFIGTLHESADYLFKTDRAPEESPPKNVPVPRPRPELPQKEEPEKGETKTPPALPKDSPSRPRDQVIGYAAKGSLRNASNLTAKTANGFQVLRPSRQRHFGSHEIMEVISYLGKYARGQSGIGTLRVGDISQKSGGKIRGSKHSSHQNGLDVDLGYPVTSQSLAQQGFVDLVSGSKVDSRLRIPETWALFKAAWATKTVDRIFADKKIKEALCAHAKSRGEIDRNGRGSMAELLRRIRPTPGHDTHFHLRIRCSTYQPQCRMIGDPPHGSGC